MVPYHFPFQFLSHFLPTERLYFYYCNYNFIEGSYIAKSWSEAGKTENVYPNRFEYIFRRRNLSISIQSGEDNLKNISPHHPLAVLGDLVSFIGSWSP